MDGFQKAGDLLFIATKKFHLEDQAISSLVCHRAKGILIEKYSHLASDWQIKKFRDGTLFISGTDASSRAELFLRTQEILDAFEEYNFPQKIQEIRIVR